MRPMTKFGLLPWLSTDLESGLDQAKTQNKPLMLVIHKTWCGACKRLKPQFESSKDIAELSEKFIMVNAQDDEEPKGQEFAPDGGYVRCVYLRSDLLCKSLQPIGSENVTFLSLAAEKACI